MKHSHAIVAVFVMSTSGEAINDHGQNELSAATYRGKGSRKKCAEISMANYLGVHAKRARKKRYENISKGGE